MRGMFALSETAIQNSSDAKELGMPSLAAISTCNRIPWICH
jgi:hypothetical protein